MTYYFERRHRSSYAPVREPCLSYGEAVWLAKRFRRLGLYDFIGVTTKENGRWKIVHDFTHEEPPDDETILGYRGDDK